MGFLFLFKLSNHLHHPHTEGLIWTLFSGFYQQVVDSLTGKHRNLKVETSSNNEDLLALHYSTSRRIAPIVLMAEPGWVIGTNKASVLGGCDFLLQTIKIGSFITSELTFCIKAQWRWKKMERREHWLLFGRTDQNRGFRD